MDRNPDGLTGLMEAARKGPISLLYASKEETFNNAAALREWLVGKLGR